jgi:gamma-glutamyl phosphate reductase
VKKLTTTIHTQESPATEPARINALRFVADLSDRKLAFFHFREAQELLGSIEYKVRDFDDEASNFQPHEADDIEHAIAYIEQHLTHVRAIATESSARVTAAVKALQPSKEGGAS